MLRVFVTGDNHIGLKYKSHEKSDVLAASRLTAFESMVDAANDEACSLFVITGDLFENTYDISKKEITALLELLSGFKGTVAILPGNHDYYDDDVKVWRYFKDAVSEFDNIMLLSEYRPYALTIDDKEVVLYPALCRSLHSAPGENNLGWIKDENITPGAACRIGIAHGAVEGETIDREGVYFLMNRSELESVPVDVWLIGHTHVPFPSDLSEKFKACDKILNPGTHVQTDVACGSEGVCFIVEIDNDKTIRAKKFVSGNLRFFRKEIDVSAETMKETLQRELSAFPDNSVVEIKISGSVTPEEYEDRDDTVNELLSRFIEASYDDSSLSRIISKELIDSEFAQTSFSAGFLTALLSDPKEAQLAYELLDSLKKEGK